MKKYNYEDLYRYVGTDAGYYYLFRLFFLLQVLDMCIYIDKQQKPKPS
jgi:hypothetical protein